MSKAYAPDLGDAVGSSSNATESLAAASVRIVKNRQNLETAQKNVTESAIALARAIL